MELLKELLSGNTVIGKVEWIGLSSSSRSEIATPNSATVVPGGIDGDHHCRPKRSSKREVTLIQAEHIAAVAGILRRSEIDPRLLRRNFVVSGINLASLKYQTFRIGTAVLKGTGNCPPCSRMEENLGHGGYSAMLNHGGITAVVVTEGVVGIGDSVEALLEFGVNDASRDS